MPASRSPSSSPFTAPISGTWAGAVLSRLHLHWCSVSSSGLRCHLRLKISWFLSAGWVPVLNMSHPECLVQTLHIYSLNISKHESSCLPLHPAGSSHHLPQLSKRAAPIHLKLGPRAVKSSLAPPLPSTTPNPIGCSSKHYLPMSHTVSITIPV